MDSPILFKSTHGDAPPVSFSTAVLSPVPPDGGYYIPTHLPHTLSLPQLAAWGVADPSYAELAHDILLPFVGDSLTSSELASSLAQAFSPLRFPHSPASLVPSVPGKTASIVELWGPSLAFKDLAVGGLIALLRTLITKKETPAKQPTQPDSHVKLNLVVATSGDTGPAAIEAMRTSPDPATDPLRLFVMFPHNRVSQEQAEQMTRGPFPDSVVVCQVENSDSDSLDTILESLFADSNLTAQAPIGSLNSINIARILLQAVHYVYAFLAHVRSGLSSAQENDTNAWIDAILKARIRFAIPTGACGNMVGGLLASLMGLPVSSFLIATNANTIVSQTLNSGILHPPSPTIHTYSNAVDISAPYNFWRFLYYTAANSNSDTLATWASLIDAGKSVTLPPRASWATPAPFVGIHISDSLTLDTIAATFATHNYLLDPHSALAAAASFLIPPSSAAPGSHTLILATAHPAKFSSAITAALPLQTSQALPSLITAMSHPSIQGHNNDSQTEPESCALRFSSVPETEAFLRSTLLSPSSPSSLPSSPTVYTLPEIQAVLDWDMAMAAAYTAYTTHPDDLEAPMPMAFEFPHIKGESHIKGAYLADSPVFVVKVASSFYSATPSGSGLVLVFSATSGTPLALLGDNGVMTDTRTAAAGALVLSTLHPLPPPLSLNIAVLGGGIQARMQVEAAAAAFPHASIASVTVWTRRPESAATYVETMRPILQPYGVATLTVAPTPEAAVAHAHIVITATPSSSPLISDPSAFVPNALILAVGSDSPSKQELGSQILLSALSSPSGAIYVDSLPQTLSFGELHHVSSHLGSDPSQHPQLHTIRSLLLSPPSSPPSGLTIVDLTGLGVQDATLAELVYTSLSNVSRL